MRAALVGGHGPAGTSPGMAGRVGLFGKVPSRGDFVRRGLPNDLVDRWDPWLQRGIADSHDTLGAGWVDAWLCAPVWRFALGAGICGSRAWAGVLMPSVDGAGRYFPLTLAGAAAGAEPPVAALLDPWMDELERLALSALDEDADFEGLVAAIEALPPVPGRGAAASWRGAATPYDPVGLAGALLASGAARAGRVLLATRGGGHVSPGTSFSLDLPVAGAFTALISDGALARPATPVVAASATATISADLSNYLSGADAAAGGGDDLFGMPDTLPPVRPIDLPDSVAAPAGAFALAADDLPPPEGGGAFDAALADEIGTMDEDTPDLFAVGAPLAGTDEDLFGDAGAVPAIPVPPPLERPR